MGAISSIDAKQRRGTRTKAVLPVRVKGRDSAGNAFEELAHTLDVTAAGVRLGAIRHELNVDDEITLLYRQRRMLFQVVWTRKMKGSSEFQVGLRAVGPEKEAWGLNFPELGTGEHATAASRATGAAQ
jgi:hypothetical protein